MSFMGLFLPSHIPTAMGTATMTNKAIIPAPRQVKVVTMATIPTMIAAAGDRAARRFVEFFTANIRNVNTRAAYARAVAQFCLWCEHRHIGLDDAEPVIIAAYIEELGQSASKPTVKQHLAAIRMLFDWFVVGQVLPANPAASVRGPKHVVRKGKTPVLLAEEARQLLDSIDVSKIAGLRDRALIGAMVYSFARVSAVVAMNLGDYFQNGKRSVFRLHEKGGKYHEVPAHHNAEQYLDEYLVAAGIAGGDKKEPLFRSLDRRRKLTTRRLDRREVLAMIKRRARRAGLSEEVCCHTFRATGITNFLRCGGVIENAARISAHSSTRTTQLYARLDDEVTLDEIERNVI